MPDPLHDRDAVADALRLVARDEDVDLIVTVVRELGGKLLARARGG